MPSEPGPTVAATPLNPLDETWYVATATRALGPYAGHEIRTMIERGEIGAETWIAKAGASQWSALADIPAFAGLGALRSVPAGPIVPPGSPHVAIPDETRPVHYAGFWIRVAAYVVDQVFIFTIVMAVSIAIGLLFGLFGLAVRARPGTEAGNIFIAVVYVAEIVILVGYQMIALSSRWQATPGKRLCGIYVIRTNGRKIGPALALGRYLCWWLSALTLYIGFIMIAFTKQKTGLHDVICGTCVIYGKAQDDSLIAEVFA